MRFCQIIYEIIKKILKDVHSKYLQIYILFYHLYKKTESQIKTFKPSHQAIYKNNKMASSNLKVYVLRLRPNQDLTKELDNFVKENDLKAAFIMTCVGSLTKATVRMAHSGAPTNEVFFFQFQKI